MIRSKRPDSLALIISVVASLLVLLAFVVGLVSARNEEIAQAEQRLQHFATMFAEHADRSLSGVDVLMREVARDLSSNRRDWRQWEDIRGWEYISERHSRSLPQLRDLILFDANGQQRFMSTVFPAPSVSVRDRPYFQALLGGNDAFSYGPLVSRNDGRYTYALTRRILDADGHFAGVLLAGLELAYFQEFCWPIRLHDEFDAYLVNSGGQIIASCRPADLSARSNVLAKTVAEAQQEGSQPGVFGKKNHLMAVVSLGALPELKVVAMLPESAALGLWKRQLNEFGLFATVIIVILLSGGWLVRRQVLELASATASLREHRQDLERRIKKATEELAEQKEEAERANVAKSRFLAAASHDLRQPLHALSLFAADLQRQVNAGSVRDVDLLATQISSSVSSLTEMLDSLLDVSRLDMGGVEPDLEVFALQTVFDRLHLAFRRAALGKRITLRIRRTACSVNSDIQLVERMLANLVSNAIRYTPEGGRVLVVARRRMDRVSVEVRDNGLGIAPEHQEMIFKEFFQVGNVARDQKKGLGLGLSIVQRLAQTLGARLDLKSRLGAGSVFAVSLPWHETPELVTPAGAGDRTQVVFVGYGAELERAVALLRDWDYSCEMVDASAPINRERYRQGAIVFSNLEIAGVVRAQMPAGWPLAAIGNGAVSEEVYPVPTPIRPARLRALVQQLEKQLRAALN